MRGRMPSTSRTLTLRCTLLQAALGAGAAGLREATTARAEVLGAQLHDMLHTLADEHVWCRVRGLPSAHHATILAIHSILTVL